MAARRLRPEEINLWRKITDDIRPLDPASHSLPCTDPVPTDEPPRPRVSVPRPGQKHLPNPTSPFPGPDAGIDRRTLLRLKRGQMKIEERLDLHDHTRDTAHQALHDFVQAAYDTRCRCVLVITGKGLRTSDAGGNPVAGVLRRAVPGWLSRDRLRQMVVSWQPAQPRHGGDGALYVLIRRRRK